MIDLQKGSRHRKRADIKCPVCGGSGRLTSPSRRPQDFSRRAIFVLRENGFSIREIAALLGYMSPNSVAHHLKRPLE